MEKERITTEKITYEVKSGLNAAIGIKNGVLFSIPIWIALFLLFKGC